ncbi:putative ring domain protein [Erysiphe neolycopersici]|uniref:RING-type E3 ubiquitin transferase n=1 Tax=Erysiphe neolycopersici TaxID=212602 RepID=A0A420I2Z6_9PEZI|nr:putative ring domain protein [Erysiphe neolycopersici]
MADHSSHNSRTVHLDATGSRNVVYCHQCEQEWWEDEFGLECPHCEGNITEIVTPGADDPRGLSQLPELVTSTPQNAYNRSWTEYSSSDSVDSEEINLDGLGGNSSVVVRTFRNSNPRSPSSENQDSRDSVTGNETRHVLSDFRNMISGFLGPQFRHSAPGRSGPETLFNEPNIQTRTFRFGGNGHGNTFVGGRIIVTNTSTLGGNSLRPRNANEPQSEGTPQVDDIVTSILAPTMSNGSAGFGFGDENDYQTESSGSQTRSSDFQAGPPGFQALLSTMLNPRNARFGDAVYSQEALDEILTTLMEQAASNAPGPASPEAIAALPKIKLDTKLLGNEGKGECSICMDEVKLGDEVIILPCKHWFDEACVTAWLKEHNTCPICRKGITEDSSSDTSNSPRNQNSSAGSQNVNRQSRRGPVRTLFLRRESRNRNEDSTDSSRTADERSQWRSSPRGHEQSDNLAPMPGSFPTDDTENRSSERSRDTRSSNSRNSNNISRSSPFHRIRGLHDRLNNNLRNN